MEKLLVAMDEELNGENTGQQLFQQGTMQFHQFRGEYLTNKLFKIKKKTVPASEHSELVLHQAQLFRQWPPALFAVAELFEMSKWRREQLLSG